MFVRIQCINKQALLWVALQCHLGCMTLSCEALITCENLIPTIPSQVYRLFIFQQLYLRWWTPASVAKQVRTLLRACSGKRVGSQCVCFDSPLLTGVDTYAGKNLIGTFHQPRAVYTDVQVSCELLIGCARYCTVIYCHCNCDATAVAAHTASP